MITVAKKTAVEKGVLADPSPTSHPSIGKEVVDLIISFYRLDDNSRMKPGRKDYVSVKTNNKRIHLQKRLILVNLKELHQLFKESYPYVKCSFSKYAALRPKHCVGRHDQNGSNGKKGINIPLHDTNDKKKQKQSTFLRRNIRLKSKL